jgi:signal transduction histidine kinase
MKVPYPRSLFARLMLIWLIGITLVLAVSFALFVGERDRVGRSALFEGIAQEIAATAEVLDRLSPAERARWIDELGRRRLRMSLRPLPDHARPLPTSHPLLPALRAAMPERAVALHQHQRGDGPGPHGGVLLVSITLADGSPLHVRLPGIPPAPTFPAPPPGRLLAALLALVGGVTLLTWLAVRIATRPLSRMAQAARRLGEAPEHAPPLATTGPAEVADAAAAFNQMQARVRDHVADRTRILAAISHDLQTPITRLRLRAELLDDDALRARFQSDLDAMQALVREGLDYARSMDASTPTQPVDVNGLLAALQADAADMGWQVTLHGHASAPCPARPGALRRALWNLIENGVKFGERVEIELAEGPASLTLSVRDHGPGLPAAELERVFEPFYRTESSRNRETGGTGLGLAIARNLLQVQGGSLRLNNHPDGGLQAVVTLPRQTAR